MKRYSATKCLLAAAVALALPSVASAAQVGFAAAGAHKYTSAVIVNQNSEIAVQPFVIAANLVQDQHTFDTAFAAEGELLVKVSLTNAEVVPGALPVAADTYLLANIGAQIDSTPEAGIAPAVDGNAGFSYTIKKVKGAAGVAANVGEYILQIPTFKIKNVRGPVTATVTLIKGLDTLFSGSGVIADLESRDPVTLTSIDPNPLERDISSVDIGDYSARTVYANNINDTTVAKVHYHAGGFALTVRSDVAGAGDYKGAGVVNTYEPLDAEFNKFRPLITSEVTVTVTGSDFSRWLPASGGYANASIWLDSTSACGNFGGTDAVRVRATNAGSSDTSLVFTQSLATNNLFGSLVTSGGATAHLCFGLPLVAGTEMVPQALSATVKLDYKTSNINNGPDYPADLRDLGYTGLVRYFHSVSPGDNPNNDSILRVVNNNPVPCLTQVHGKRDNGTIAGPILIDLQAGQSIDIPSHELEGGSPNAAVSGSIGGGQVRWQLRTTSLCDNADSFVIQRNRTGINTLTNLHHTDGVDKFAVW